MADGLDEQEAGAAIGNGLHDASAEVQLSERAAGARNSAIWRAAGWIGAAGCRAETASQGDVEAVIPEERGGPVQLTERVNRISVSPTSAVGAEAEKYKDRGVDLVDFGPGEAHFPTPEPIKQAATRAIEQNFTKYTPT